MSRNLCRTDCAFCGGDVKKTSEDRPITREDCGVYFDEYAGMVVADAACVDCEAPYLAWIDGTKRAPVYVHGHRFAYPEPFRDFDSDFLCIRDLSHKQAFNDEPGPKDYPRWQMVRSRAPWPRCRVCEAPLRRPNGPCDREWEHDQKPAPTPQTAEEP